MTALIEFSAVGCHDRRYGTPLLADLDFTLAAGEAVALVGPAGAGKSTALGLVVGESRPTRGEVHVFGTNTAHLDQAGLVHLRSRIGFVPQQGALLGNLTLLENLELPLRYHQRADGAHIAEALREACALLEIEPEDIPLCLPGGATQEMRQLVALARSLALRPQVLIVDEPALGLGGNAQREIWRLLATLRERSGIAVLVASHDQAAARGFTDHVVALPARHHDTRRMSRSMRI
jgi:phospholipid/cholesterol/gamma-HCH transport system ATP-binding protein